MSKFLRLAMLAMLAMLVAAPGALAAEVGGTGPAYTFNETGGPETNTVTVTQSGASPFVTFNDSTNVITTTRGDCSGSGTNTVTCTTAPTSISLSLGANDDQTTFSNVTASVTQSGGGGNDILRQSNGPLSSNGDAGNDTLTGGGLADTLNGGPDDDTINGGVGNDTIDGGTGVDTIDAGPDNDTNVRGGDGNDTINGGDGNDNLFGEGGTDTLNGQNGNDTLQGGAGGDTLDGGANDAFGGNDIADYQDQNGVTVTVNGTSNDGDNLSALEGIFGSPGNDTLNGDNGNNPLSGLGGNDVLNGNGGDDFGFGGPFGGGLSGGPGDDTINGGAGVDSANGDDGNDTINGGDGDDAGLFGGPGNDTINGNNGGDGQLFGGDGNDNLQGGDGEDGLFGGSGADNYDGGNGIDGASVDWCLTFDPVTFDCTDASRNVSVTLDNNANDGRSGEGDNVRSNIEDINTGEGADNVNGNDEFNQISTGELNDTINPGGGSDLVFSGSGDDTINARDGFNDRIFCGPGNDFANVDQFDQVDSTCENVSRQTVAPGGTDRPPSVEFASPAANARLSADRPTPITVNASDDRGVAEVRLIDDGVTVAVDNTAPYQFNYQPRGDDVGDNTLIAVAIDTSQQAGTAFREFIIDRFTPRSVSITPRPTRDRQRPYRFTFTGRVTLPAGVTAAQGCTEGTVTVVVKRASRTISTRRATLRRNCTYTSTVTFRDRRRVGRTGRLNAQARFSGNDVLARRNSSRRNLRAG